VEVLAAVLATAFAIAVAFVQPIGGRRRYRALLARAAVDPGARLHHYRRGIAGEWISVALIVVIGVLAGHTVASIGLKVPNDTWFSARHTTSAASSRRRDGLAPRCALTAAGSKWPRYTPRCRRPVWHMSGWQRSFMSVMNLTWLRSTHPSAWLCAASLPTLRRW